MRRYLWPESTVRADGISASRFGAHGERRALGRWAIIGALWGVASTALTALLSPDAWFGFFGREVGWAVRRLFMPVWWTGWLIDEALSRSGSLRDAFGQLSVGGRIAVYAVLSACLGALAASVLGCAAGMVAHALVRGPKRGTS
ncbi:MAG: hypothetical protein QMD96_02305 [Anaerosomatales bacterium]|nr:hypothetical protein [Anaerosomatales bacterium]